MKDFMHYKGYYGSVHFDEQDLIFHGKIEFIRALVTYEATHAVGLKKAFQESVDDYLETCRTQKINPEVSFKGSDRNIDYSDIPALDESFFKRTPVKFPQCKDSLTLRVDHDVLMWFKASGRGYQTLINAVLKSYVKAHQHHG